MNQWWASLESRERLLVSVMGVFIIIAAIYWLLIQPLFQGTQDARDRLATAEQNLTWMKRVAPTLTAETGSDNRRPSGGTLIAIVSQTGNNFGLDTRDNRVVSNDKLQVRLDDSPFENLVKWFGALHNESVFIDTANFTRAEDTPGTTNATVTVKKGSL